MICQSCGKQLKDGGASFCTWCGEPIQAPMPRKAGKRWPYILLLVVVLSIGVVMVLGFAGPRWFLGGGGKQSNPEATVNSYLKALETKDAVSILSLLDPDYIKAVDDMLNAAGTVTVDEAISEDIFNYQSIRFEGVAYDTSINGNVASIRIIAGAVTGTDINGTTTTLDIANSSFSDYRLTLMDGNWYIMVSPTGISD